MLKYRLFKDYNDKYKADAYYYRLCSINEDTGEIVNYVDEAVELTALSLYEMFMQLRDMLEQLDTRVTVDEPALRNHLGITGKGSKKNTTAFTAKSKELVNSMAEYFNDGGIDEPILSHSLVEALQNSHGLEDTAAFILQDVIDFTYELLEAHERGADEDELMHIHEMFYDKISYNLDG